MVNPDKIKQKIISINPDRWWGDDFDVRFYLLSKLSRIRDKMILDVGGGVGIISSELDKTNFSVNLDISFQDLIKCNEHFDTINCVNSSMLDVSFKENSFDCVICAHLLEEAKLFDMNNNKVKNEKINRFPSVDGVLGEIYRVLKPGGILLITTPNNSYYNSTKLSYEELELHLKNKFENYSIFLYNTLPRLSSKSRKLNLASTLPKILSRIKSKEDIISGLVRDINKNRSVSFYVSAIK